MTTNFWSFFSLQTSMYMLNDICVIDISAIEKQNCLLHLLTLEFRVV